MNEALGWGEGQGEGKRKKERGVRKGIERITHRKKRRPLQELQKTADHTLLPVSLPDPLHSEPHYLWSLPVHLLWTCEHYLKITIESLPIDCYQTSKLLINSGRKARLSTDRSLSEDGERYFCSSLAKGSKAKITFTLGWRTLG